MAPIPDHPVRGGAAFSPDPAALAELAGWFAHGDAVLREIAARAARTLPVRVWPHHFDAGSIRYLGEPGPSAPQIGFGLSPGDRYYEQPYFYVTAFPLRPDPRFRRCPMAGSGVSTSRSWERCCLARPLQRRAIRARYRAASWRPRSPRAVR
jgi:hypothetical protein